MDFPVAESCNNSYVYSSVDDVAKKLSPEMDNVFLEVKRMTKIFSVVFFVCGNRLNCKMLAKNVFSSIY